MKKYITLVALGASLTAGAQQIQGDFEQWKDCVVYRGKDVATKKVGNDPQGWNGSNISQKGAVLGLSDKDDATLVTKVSGNVEGFAVQLQNKFVGALTIGAVAPAYVTLGTPWAYAKVNGTKIESSDGGTFGGLDFTYLPDALQFDYTLKRKENSTQPATISAYLWKGSYTATQKVGYNGKEEQMTDRDRFVLGTQTSTASEDSKLIATLQASINKDNSEWNTKTVPFEYKENGVSPEKINVIFCAGDYYGDQSLLERDNIFIVDNVKLIYYHALSTLSYEGATLNFNKEQIEYDLSEVEYEDKKLSYTKLGQGASVSTSYNEKTAILTITVKGNDYNEDTNSEAKTVYTVQFKKPAQTAVKGVKIGGEKYEDFDAETKEYTLPYAYNRGIYFETETEEGAEVSVVYNDEDETVTIQEGENSFVFKFTPAVEGQYSGTYPARFLWCFPTKKATRLLP